MSIIVCRLCMASEFLMDLSTLDGDSNISLKAESCIGIQVYANDGMPTHICNTCKEMLNIFFNFKQKCLEVDMKLRRLARTQSTNNESNTINYTLNKKLDSSKLMNIENTKGGIIKENSKRDDIVYDASNFKEYTTHRKFQCEICGRIFKMKAALENHVLTHSGLKPFQCQLCPKRYCRLENVNIHMRSHAGIKPYVCEICGKTSTKHQDLVRHMKIHSDERNYTCPRCDRQFKRASDVTSHMRTHSGMRPYLCQTCKKTYTSHSGLRKHRKSHCKLLKIPGEISHSFPQYGRYALDH